METARRICENIHKFYSPTNGVKDIFYIRENEIIFPEGFEPTEGQQPGKGSFFEKESIICEDNKVEARLKVHAFVPSEGDKNESQEVIVVQRETWSWDENGKLSLAIDFLDEQGSGLGDPFVAEVLAFNEDNIDLQIVIPLPRDKWAPNAPAKTSNCTVNLFQTNVRHENGVDIYNTFKFLYLDEQDRVLEEQQLMPKYIAYSTNADNII